MAGIVLLHQCDMSLMFQWDKEKAESNLKKHGIPFEEAATAFGDTLSITIADPAHSVGEIRYLFAWRHDCPAGRRCGTYRTRR